MLGKKRGIRTIGAMVTFIPQRLEEFEPPAAGGLLAVQPLYSWSWATGCKSTEVGNDVAQGPARPFYHGY